MIFWDLKLMHHNPRKKHSQGAPGELPAAGAGTYLIAVQTFGVGQSWVMFLSQTEFVQLW